MMERAFVSRVSSLWLIAVLVLVLLPVWNQLPVVIIALGVVTVLWRLFILLGRGLWPPGWLRGLLVVLSLSAVAVSFRPLISLESAVAVLAAGYSLKLLELRTRRDALVVVYIGYFLIASAVLFSQTLLHTLYLACCLVALVAAQQGLYQHSGRKSFRATLRFAVSLAAQALPVTILLFVLVPRLGPIWSVPLPDQSSRTGLTDEMTPGDIARLSRSDELAFRAQFEGDVPPPEDRYWRAVVLDQFDGKTWRQTGEEYFLRRGVSQKELVTRNPVLSSWWQAQSEGYQYEIMMEPTSKPWLYSLGYPAEAVKESRLLRTFRLEYEKPVSKRRLYRVNLSSLVPPETSEYLWMLTHNLQLPVQGNERSRALAATLMAAAKGDPLMFATRLMSKFNAESYIYTLQPLLANDVNSIDQFLFENKAGFCAHYAGAFVYLMRSVGVPARVITGYQGGEVKEGNLIQVRQFDAHAWAEIWVADRGWVRFDPTSAVAPDRVRAGLESALTRETFLPDSPFSLYRYRDTRLLNKLRLSYEQLEYQWQRSVVNYTRERQQQFLGGLLGRKDLLFKQGALLGAGVFIVIGLMSLILLFRRRKSNPLAISYERFEQVMKKWGYVRASGEGEQTFAERVAAAEPVKGKLVIQFTQEYIRQAYQQNADTNLKKLKGLLKQLA